MIKKMRRILAVQVQVQLGGVRRSWRYTFFVQNTVDDAQISLVFQTVSLPIVMYSSLWIFCIFTIGVQAC